jgi:hypothetical protein
MPNRTWTMTVNYRNGVVTLTDSDGSPIDKTIYRTETDTITFQPGPGVRSVTALSITSPCPLPAGVSVTWTQSGNDLVVTDVDSLASDALEVDVVYCVQFIDSNGNSVTSDPKLINMPTLRPS